MIVTCTSCGSMAAISGKVKYVRLLINSIMILISICVVHGKLKGLFFLKVIILMVIMWLIE